MWDYDENGNTYFTELGQKCANDASCDLTGVEWTSPYTGKTYTLDGTFSDGGLQMNNITWALGATNPDSNGEKFSKVTWASQIGDAKNDAEADWRAKTGADSTQKYLDSTDYSMEPGMLEGYALQAVAHGADLLSFFRWRTSISGAEMFCHGLLDHDNRKNRRLTELEGLCRRLRKLPALSDTTVVSQVAVLYSSEQEYALKNQRQSERFAYWTQLRLLHDFILWPSHPVRPCRDRR